MANQINSNSTPDPFGNLSTLRLGQSFADKVGVKKLLTTVPVRKPNRQDWRLVREVFVADTDEEAWKLSSGDMMGRMMGEYFLPLLGHFGFKDYLKATPDVPDSDVTVDYCARHN